MIVKVTIEGPKGDCIEHVAKVVREGDLLQAASHAMEAYRKKHHDLPLFDHSTIKIERVEGQLSRRLSPLR